MNPQEEDVLESRISPEEIKGSVEILNFLHDTLQPCTQFDNGIKLQWMKELKAWVKDFEAANYIVVQQPEHAIKEPTKRKTLNMSDFS